MTIERKDAPHPTPRSRNLAARSCRGCHQRKIRCDRAVPCTHCSRCGITCVYPTKESDMARKDGPTLQSISNRLERLEVLLSRLAEDGQVTARAADRRRRDSQTQLKSYSSGNDNSTEALNRHPSNEDPGASTWELLLNEEEVVQYANTSLAGNVSLFLSFALVLLTLLRNGQANMHQLGGPCPKSTIHRLGNYLLTYPEKCKPSWHTACTVKFSHFFKFLGRAKFLP